MFLNGTQPYNMIKQEVDFVIRMSEIKRIT